MIQAGGGGGGSSFKKAQKNAMRKTGVGANGFRRAVRDAVNEGREEMVSAPGSDWNLGNMVKDGLKDSADFYSSKFKDAFSRVKGGPKKAAGLKTKKPAQSGPVEGMMQKIQKRNEEADRLSRM